MDVNTFCSKCYIFESDLFLVVGSGKGGSVFPRNFGGGGGKFPACGGGGFPENFAVRSTSGVLAEFGIVEHRRSQIRDRRTQGSGIVLATRIVRTGCKAKGTQKPAFGIVGLIEFDEGIAQIGTGDEIDRVSRDGLFLPFDGAGDQTSGVG